MFGKKKELEKNRIAKKNRIAINFTSSTIEVESSTESLSAVFGAIDQIARNLGRGSLDGKDGKDRAYAVGIR